MNFFFGLVLLGYCVRACGRACVLYTVLFGWFDFSGHHRLSFDVAVFETVFFRFSSTSSTSSSSSLVFVYFFLSFASSCVSNKRIFFSHINLFIFFSSNSFDRCQLEWKSARIQYLLLFSCVRFSSLFFTSFLLSWQMSVCLSIFRLHYLSRTHFYLNVSFSLCLLHACVRACTMYDGCMCVMCECMPFENEYNVVVLIIVKCSEYLQKSTFSSVVLPISLIRQFQSVRIPSIRRRYVRFVRRDFR